MPRGRRSSAVALLAIALFCVAVFYLVFTSSSWPGENPAPTPTPVSKPWLEQIRERSGADAWSQFSH